MANYIASLELAYLQHLANEERERQDAIVTARNLYDGTIASTLLAELKAALLSGDTTVVPALLNIYRTKVEEIEARLTVNDFYDEPQHDGRPPAGNRLPWVARLWVDVGLAMEQHEVHQAVLRDGESFVILNPDPQRGVCGRYTIRDLRMLWPVATALAVRRTSMMAQAGCSFTRSGGLSRCKTAIDAGRGSG